MTCCLFPSVVSELNVKEALYFNETNKNTLQILCSDMQLREVC
jgi:hypothetical protein